MASQAKTTAAGNAGVVQAKGFFKRAPTVVGIRLSTSEADRLKEDKTREKNWKRWGPYLSERQWATVREDYSTDGSWLVDTCSVINGSQCIYSARINCTCIFVLYCVGDIKHAARDINRLYHRKHLYHGKHLLHC